MHSQPTEIRRTNDGLRLAWPDGTAGLVGARALRTNCPCADCRMKRGDDSHASPLTPKKRLLAVIEASAEEETRLEEIWGIGNYAVGMRWGDGHSTGIYTFDLLRRLMEETRGD